MKKRLLSLLAVFCLVAAMLPTPARADDVGAGDTPPDLFQRIYSLNPAEGGTKADIASVTKTQDGVYEIKLAGTATPSLGAAPTPAYWIGVGIAPPDGYTSVAYFAGDYSNDEDVTFILNNNTGTLDDIQEGGEGFALWFDADSFDDEGFTYTVKWWVGDDSVLYEVYHFTWDGSTDGDLSDVTPDDPSEDDPSKDDPSKDDPSKDDPSKDDPSKDDPPKDDPPKPSATTYTVTIASGITHGTVTAKPTTAKKGETVTLTIKPDSGYSLDTITTTPTRTLSGSGGTRTFTMPESNVTVSATFTKAAALTGSVTIEGDPWVGETLTARVRYTNNTGTLYYQWTADGYDIRGETSSTLLLTRSEVGKTIRCVVTSSVQTGSITGRFWDTVDYYSNRYSPPESTTDTDQGSDAEAENGFAPEAPILTTATNADGTKTTTVIDTYGSSALITLTSYGTVVSASVTFSSEAFAAARRTGSALTLPTTVQSSRSADSAAPVRIVLPLSAGSVKVKVPVSQMTAGTVAVMENYFGPDTVVKSSVSQSDGVLFELTGGAVVKVVDNTKSFRDVSDGMWYTNAVKWASSREVMTGVSAQSFDPQGAVNRAMMAQMLYNFDGAGDKGVTSQFSDVSSGDWYAASVTWATKNGIARNYGGRFGAEDALTREDMAVMLYNYAKLIGYNPYASGSITPFTDNGSVSDWARTAMQWAVGAGLITGTQNGTKAVVLDPQGTVTRAQLATIMQRFNNLY